VRPSSGGTATRQGTPATGTAGTGPAATGTRGRWLLETGGWLAAVMGAAHFVLPVIYPWETHVEGLYPPVRWALSLRRRDRSR
jgi:hypothetical protein